ncbi:Outer spore wall assembly protein SHE10 [Spathaspora sp. JA1]|nr:Outer spore wall assembly protein SHE10 [Spathaspora sp. JA1]
MNTKLAWLATILSLYVFYAWTFVCPLNTTTSLSVNEDLPPVSYHFCTISNGYIKPIYQQHVIPQYQSKIVPVFKVVDGKVGVVDKVKSTIEFIQIIDSKFHISESIGLYAGKSGVFIKESLETYVIPYVDKIFESSQGKFSVYYYIVKNFISSIWDQSNTKFQNSVLPYISPLISSLTSTELVQQAIDWYNRLFDQVINSKHAVKLQEKSSFLKNEFNNLFKFDEFYPSIPKSRNVVQVVKDILNNIGGGSNNINEDSDGGEEEYETVYLTSTISVTSSSLNSVSTEDPVISQLQSEISYWENKVNKTVELAMNNLEVEMKPLIDELIEKIKPNISQQLQGLQKGHHLQYQTLNKKISEINRDYDKIKESKDTTIETINRQEIRDDIAASYKLAEDSSDSIQKILIDSHKYILEEYFKVTQQTIDILETFSETTMAEFSKRLGNMIHELDLDDNEISWAIWKRFHTVKESLFDFRDFILNSANEYKNTNSKDDKVIGMKVWNEYLRNVEFHLNFLLRDNADYLQLIRAKANIAFQMREGLVYDLKKEETIKIEKEREEQQKKEQVERETLKRFQERMEQEKQEKEKARIEKAEKEKIKIQQLEEQLWQEILQKRKASEADSNKQEKESVQSQTELDQAEEKLSNESGDQANEQTLVQENDKPLSISEPEASETNSSEVESSDIDPSELDDVEVSSVTTPPEEVTYSESLNFEDTLDTSISQIETTTTSEFIILSQSDSPNPEASSDTIVQHELSDDSSLTVEPETKSASEILENIASSQPELSKTESAEIESNTLSGETTLLESSRDPSTVESPIQTSLLESDLN